MVFKFLALMIKDVALKMPITSIAASTLLQGSTVAPNASAA